MEVISPSGIASPNEGKPDVPRIWNFGRAPSVVSPSDRVRHGLGAGVSQRARLEGGRFIPDPNGDWVICTSQHYDGTTGALRD